MEDIYVSLSKQSRNARNYFVLVGILFVILGVVKMSSNNGFSLSGLLHIVAGVLAIFGGMVSPSGDQKFVRLNRELIVYKLGLFSKEKQIQWADITTVQINKKMVKVDYNQNQSMELFDFSRADDDELLEIQDAIRAIAKERGVKVE